MFRLSYLVAVTALAAVSIQADRSLAAADAAAGADLFKARCGICHSPDQGTKMTFPGIKNDEQRAAVIAYLETLKP